MGNRINMELSNWINLDHTSMRIIKGSDPLILANRIAFIEKSPRVRIKEYTNHDSESDKWEFGYGTSRHGEDLISRRWCDEKLIELGYTLNHAPDAFLLKFVKRTDGKNTKIGYLYFESINKIDEFVSTHGIEILPNGANWSNTNRLFYNGVSYKINESEKYKIKYEK